MRNTRNLATKIIILSILSACQTPSIDRYKSRFLTPENISKSIERYKSRYPDAPAGQAEYFHSEKYSRRITAPTECIIEHDGYFHSKLQHIPELAIHVFGTNVDESIKSCTNDPIFVPFEVNYSQKTLWNNRLKLVERFKSVSLDHRMKISYENNLIEIIAKKILQQKCMIY